MTVSFRRVVIVCLVVASVTFTGCGSGREYAPKKGVGTGDRIPGSDADPSTATMSHVHGIGRNPADDKVYVATHHGLWQVSEPGNPKLVGKYQHDFMGFSIVGPDHFVASGHPNAAGDLPPNLGLIESKDAGKSWFSRSLLGEADFHALRVTGGSTYGWNSQDAALMVSENDTDWDTVSDGAMMLDIAIDPEQSTTMLASVAKDQATLEVQRSSDSGRSFLAVDGAPQIARFAWPERSNLYGFAADGTVYLSRDAGESWNKVGNVEAFPDAVAGSGDELLAAAGGSIRSSRDGGRTFDELASYG